jgi:leucyl aminopeptidase
MDSKHMEIINELAATLHKSPTASFSMFGSNGKDLHALYFIPVYMETGMMKDSTTFEYGRKIDVFRSTGAELVQTLNHNAINEFNLRMLEHSDSSYAFIEGLLLALYRFNKYKTDLDAEASFNVKNIHLIHPINTSQKILEACQDHCNNLMVQTRSVFMARDLINEPANRRSVVDFIEIIKKFIEIHKIPVKMRVIETKDLSKMGMNLLVSVGNASMANNRSRLMILESSAVKPKKQVDYVLIGKGVMFDTGGINIKADDDDLYQEKTDMAGAAIIASFILGYSKLGGKQSVVGLLPLTQNDIGPKGTHAGDVLTSYSGKTVEIVNTDAEGRLLLADCLSYADKNYKHATMIDMATLTGDQAYMSCKTFSSAISRHPDLVKRLVDAGNIIQERIMESPYVEEFLSYLESPIADIKNIGNSSCRSDALIAGVFLGEFVNPKTPWIHLDIAGTAYGMNDIKAYYPAEGSAIGVRLLFEFIDNSPLVKRSRNTKKVSAKDVK